MAVRGVTMKQKQRDLLGEISDSRRRDRERDVRADSPSTTELISQNATRRWGLHRGLICGETLYSLSRAVRHAVSSRAKRLGKDCSGLRKTPDNSFSRGNWGEGAFYKSWF